jgi:phosphatidylglycerol lysyltransferase
LTARPGPADEIELAENRQRCSEHDRSRARDAVAGGLAFPAHDGRTIRRDEDIGARQAMKAPDARSWVRATLTRLESRKEAIGLIAVVVVLVLCGFALRRLLAEMRLADVGAAIAALPTANLFASQAFTFASFVALIGYDWSALRYVRRRLPLRVIALASFCGYAIGNTVGFALLTGGSVRYRIYTAAGLSSEDVGRVALFCVIAFGFGICAVSGVGILLRPGLLAGILLVDVAALKALSIALLAAIVAFLALCASRRSLRWRGISLPLPRPSLVAGQLAISALDLCLASAALFVLLPKDLGFSFFGFLPVYCVAIVASVASHVPGGLGVFEAVIVFALGDKTDKSALVGALVTYRLVYYVLPLLIAGALLGANEVRQQMPATRAALQRVLDLTGAIVPTAASLFVVLAGIVLLASGATPMEPTRAAVIPSIFPLPVVEASHLIGSLIASALILLAPALQRRLNAAYWVALVCLFTGIVVSLAKGLDYEEAILLAVIALLLLPYRSEFYRQTSLLDQPFTLEWVVAIACILGATFWLMLFAYKHVEYDHRLWFQFEFEGDAPRSLRAMFASVLGVVGYASLRLLRPPRRAVVAASPEEIERARAIAVRQERADALLVLMGDKSLLFSHSGRSFLMFGRHRMSWINLFDPIGLQEERRELIWRFRELCDRARTRPAFYQVRPDNIPLYIDAGLTLTKLGEEARISLPEFDLALAKYGKLRYAIKRGCRDGLSFQVFARPQVSAVVDQLGAVSEAWLKLKNVREKSFSLGAFTPDYVANFDVGAVRKDDRIVAFATLLLTETGAEASLDVMRHRPDAPNLTMEFLITSLLLEMKQRGLHWFSLGMAPLSGLERRRLAPLWHQVGAIVLEHGDQFYNFRGLRQFKQKFEPLWEPRYLASPGGVDPLIVLADAAALIGGGSLMGAVRK